MGMVSAQVSPPAIRNMAIRERDRLPNSSGASSSKKVTPIIAKSAITTATMKKA